MVEFRSLSASSCIRSSSFLPELSITFSNKNLSFGTIDIGLFPNAAEKFGITLGSLHQLPTYILFHNGAVISRLPEVDYEATFFDSPVSKRLLCRHFELDKLFFDYINDEFRCLEGGICLSSMGRPISYERAVAGKVLNEEEEDVHSCVSCSLIGLLLDSPKYHTQKIK
ncbi:hypothetical protein OROGR_005918 [Orobanche gracilis]